jgi:hypothetical protein
MAKTYVLADGGLTSQWSESAGDVFDFGGDMIETGEHEQQQTEVVLRPRSWTQRIRRESFDEK